MWILGSDIHGIGGGFVIYLPRQPKNRIYCQHKIFVNVGNKKKFLDYLNFIVILPSSFSMFHKENPTRNVNIFNMNVFIFFRYG